MLRAIDTCKVVINRVQVVAYRSLDIGSLLRGVGVRVATSLAFADIWLRRRHSNYILRVVEFR